MSFQAATSLAQQIAERLAQQIICGELKAGERIQEVRITQSLNVSRGSVREALLILERRHLIEILPNRGAHVVVLDSHKVGCLYELMMTLYTQLAHAVAERWLEAEDLTPLQDAHAQLQAALERDDIGHFVDLSFATMRKAYVLANNPYLQETIENLQPVIARTYHLAIEQRRSSMGEFLDGLQLLQKALQTRDKPLLSSLIEAYCQHNCQLVLAALQA